MKKKKTEEELANKWREETLSTPSSWRCKYGFHLWSKWVFGKTNICHPETGQKLYERTTQRRICIRCNLDDRREV